MNDEKDLKEQLSVYKTLLICFCCIWIIALAVGIYLGCQTKWSIGLWLGFGFVMSFSVVIPVQLGLDLKDVLWELDLLNLDKTITYLNKIGVFDAKIEKEIKMNFSIPDLVCQIYDERDKIFIDIIKKDVEENPEYYKGIDLITISREELKDLLIKGKKYNKLQNDLKFSNENFDMLMKRYENLKADLQNEASNAEFYKSERDNLERTLEELREACDNFICEFDSQDHIMYGYNLPYETRYSIIKQRIEEFEDEINGERD